MRTLDRTSIVPVIEAVFVDISIYLNAPAAKTELLTEADCLCLLYHRLRNNIYLEDDIECERPVTVHSQISFPGPDNKRNKLVDLAILHSDPIVYDWKHYHAGLSSDCALALIEVKYCRGDLASDIAWLEKLTGLLYTPGDTAIAAYVACFCTSSFHQESMAEMNSRYRHVQARIIAPDLLSCDSEKYAP